MRFSSSWRTCSTHIVVTALPVLLLTPPVTADVFTWSSNGQPTPYEWSNHLNWIGPANQFPSSSSDTAVISASGIYDPILDANYVIGALTLQADGVLWTGEGPDPGDLSFRLAVSSVGGGTGFTLVQDPGSRLDVYRSSNMNDLDTDDLVIAFGGVVRLLQGGIIQVDDHLDIQPGAELSGEGAVEFTRDDGTNDPRNGGLIRSNGGTLTFTSHPDSVFDLDGPDGTGSLHVTELSKLIFDMDVESSFSGTITIEPRAELHINDPWGLANTGTLTITAGSGDHYSMIAGVSASFTGPVMITGGDTRLAVRVVFAGDVTLADDAVVWLEVQGYIVEDATFTGDGSLIIKEGVLVEVGHGAHVGVPVHSDGLIVLDGEVANIASFTTLTLGPTAQCRLAICEPIPGQAADQVQVTGTATLDGQLDLVHIQNCDPDPGDEFEIITAGNITGQFSEITGITNVEIMYSETAVTVLITEPCPADLDGDGDVGSADLAQLLAAWGPNPGHTADLNGDGIVDSADLAALLSAWGSCS